MRSPSVFVVLGVATIASSSVVPQPQAIEYRDPQLLGGLLGLNGFNGLLGQLLGNKGGGLNDLLGLDGTLSPILNAVGAILSPECACKVMSACGVQDSRCQNQCLPQKTCTDSCWSKYGKTASGVDCCNKQCYQPMLAANKCDY